MSHQISKTIFSVIAAASGLLLSSTPAAAGEGGSSGYLQGTFNDFSAGVMGPEGVYVRLDIARYEGDVGARPLGGRVQLGAEQELFVTIAKVIYLSDAEFLGARIGTGVTLPVVPEVNASLDIAAGPVNGFIEGDNGGVGDLYLNPILLGWTAGDFHIVFAPGLLVPTGEYDVDRAINLGRNYWAIDPSFAVTYLDPESGIDASVTFGVMFNFENEATDYTTGNELHVDFNIARMVSPQFGVGITGYYYDQLTDDEGDLPGFAQDGFQGRGAGIGPSFVYNTQLGGMPLSIIGKALFDIDSRNRFDGDIVMISLATKL